MDIQWKFSIVGAFGLLARRKEQVDFGFRFGEMRITILFAFDFDVNKSYLMVDG